MRCLFVLQAAALILLSSCSSVNPNSSNGAVNEASTRIVSPAEPVWRYEGRVDLRNALQPCLVWQGTRLSFDFESSSLVLKFENEEGQSFFDAYVDGHRQLISLRNQGFQKVTIATDLKRKRHHFLLFKRSEAAKGHVRFLGAEIDPEGAAFPGPTPDYAVRLFFFGDSITAGACNEDPGPDQWEDFSTHNNAESYGAITARELKADYRNVSVSGMGVCEGYVAVTASDIWDKYYPTAASPKAEPDGWKPDVLFVNLGENDISFTQNQGRPFPAGYTEGYRKLVKNFRNQFPDTQIVLLRGGMGGGANGVPLRNAWEAAVTALEAEDPKVSHFVFTHWSAAHPRVSDATAMSKELVAWLRAQPFMKRFVQ